MVKIKTMLVDDEPPAIALLENYVGMIDQLEIVATCNSAVKAFDLLQKTQVDLLLLDIRMPVLNGIDLIKTLGSPPSIILTTAYREYALDGYDLDIIDYLLKPISFARFLKAVDRYTNRTSSSTSKDQAPANLPDDHVFFTINRSQHKVLLDDILFIESLKDYVRIHTTDKPLVVKGNIGTILKRLPPHNFIRIHRSFAISLTQLQSFSQIQVQVAGHTIPIGASYKKEALNKLRTS